MVMELNDRRQTAIPKTLVHARMNWETILIVTGVFGVNPSATNL
jgi:hypothetical protein